MSGSRSTPEEKRARRIVRMRRYNMRSLYGLTLEQLEQMHAEQGGRCKICRRETRLWVGVKNNSACVDHDHATGQVRGLLCRRCNAALGQFQEQPELLERAAQYLRASGKVGC